MSTRSQGPGSGRRRRASGPRDASGTGAGAPGPRLGPAEWAASLDADAILAAARQVLAQTGLAAVLPSGVGDRAAAAGIEIAGDRLRFAPDAISALLALAPSRFTHLSPSGAHDLEIGSGRVHLGPAMTARFMWGGRKSRFVLGPTQVREACDIAAAIGLAYDGGGLAATAAAGDAHQRTHLLCASGRPLIATLGAGLSAAALRDATAATHEPLHGGEPRCRLLAILPVDAALTLPHDTLADLAMLVEAGAGIVVAPVLLIGTTTPAGAIGALVRLAAETMAVAALVQTIRPGTPVAIGVQVGEASMRNGMPLASTAEALKVVAGARVVARRLALPSFALGPATAAKGFDAQAGGETAAWLSVALRHDVVLGLGGLELDDGLSLEKLLLDAELAVSLSASTHAEDAATAAAAILAAGPGGVHIGERATREAARRGPRSALADDWVIEGWLAAGSPDAADRAQVVLAQMLMARVSTSDPLLPATEPVLQPASRRTLTDIAADGYSRAMRDAFGFKD